VREGPHTDEFGTKLEEAPLASDDLHMRLQGVEAGGGHIELIVQGNLAQAGQAQGAFQVAVEINLRQAGEYGAAITRRCFSFCSNAGK